MRIERWDPADDGTALGLYAVARAAHQADDQVEPPESAGTFRSRLTGDWEGAPGEVWYQAGEPVPAYYRLDLPDLENTDRAFVGLVTHPAARHHGAGQALLRHAAQRGAAHGRTILEGYTLEGTAGDAFARTTGATFSIEEARRVQELRALPPERIAELRAAAEQKAAGYSLETWTGPVPGARAAALAEVYNAFADAPRGEGVAPEVWDAARVRQRTGKLLREGHLRGYTVAAIHDATGEMAAITDVLVDPLEPAWGMQQLTAVTRPYRGHRLGLLVKTAMLEWLAEAEPALERIVTGNAVGNDHMIGINEALGYRLVPPAYRFYEIPVAAVLADELPADQPQS